MGQISEAPRYIVRCRFESIPNSADSLPIEVKYLSVVAVERWFQQNYQ
jgi:hypothetical protein